MKRTCCDICGCSSDFPMYGDLRLKKEFDINVDICISCSGWLDDRDRYERLLDNGIIDENVYVKLVYGNEDD